VLIAASTVPGVAWPAIPSAAASLMLAMQHQLASTQWLSSEALPRLPGGKFEDFISRVT
jgi:hypothetical protein